MDLSQKINLINAKINEIKDRNRDILSKRAVYEEQFNQSIHTLIKEGYNPPKEASLDQMLEWLRTQHQQATEALQIKVASAEQVLLAIEQQDYDKARALLSHPAAQPAQTTSDPVLDDLPPAPAPTVDAAFSASGFSL